MLVSFAFMYGLLFCFCTRMLLSDIKRANRQNILKYNSNSDVRKMTFVSYGYVSYVKSEASNIQRVLAWFLKPFGERLEKNHIYHLIKPNTTVKTRTVHRAFNVCYQVFSKMKKLTLRAIYVNFKT